MKLSKNLILIIVGVENKKINNKNNDKINKKLIKSNNLTKLSKFFYFIYLNI